MPFLFPAAGNITDEALARLNGASAPDTTIATDITYPFITGINVAGMVGGRLVGAMGTWISATQSSNDPGSAGDNSAGVFNVNATSARSLIDSAHSFEPAVTTQFQIATDEATSEAPAAQVADGGESAGGLGPTGQLWFITEGGDAETRLAYINNDDTSQTTVASNGGAGTGDDQFISSFTSDIGLDTAAGFYFAILSNSIDDHAVLVRGTIGSSAAPTTVIDFPDDIIVNTIEIDAANHKIYATYMDGQTADPAGIRVYSYNSSTGAITDDGFLVEAADDTRGPETGDAGSYDIILPRDMALDSSIGRLFYTETLTGGLNATGLFRLDLSDPGNSTVQLVSQAQFPDSGANGYIIDVEVDQTTDLVYFSTQSQHASPYSDYVASQNAIWYIGESASSGTATKVTLNGMPGGNHFYPGDMTFDHSNRRIYVETEEVDGVGTDDVIYVFQLDGAGTSATLINTINPGLTTIGANIEGLAFSHIVELNGLTGTSTLAVEQQAAATTLLAVAPSISDFDGNYLKSASVQITGGTFSSNESSTNDDHLGYGAAKQISGLISGTNITISWTAATENLTLTGYDTLAHYQSVLSALTYWTTGDNPTNYGLNTSRTVTWTINDGTPGVTTASLNTGTTTINLQAVNDAPINGTVTSATGNEESNIAITGLQISDPDSNAALTNLTVSLSVTKGVLTLLTNVSNGLTSGDITGNGSASVTLTGTLNEINATLAAASGVVFTGNTNAFGTDTLTVVSNDGGNSGSGGAQSDTDNYTITINGINDTHTGGASVTGATTEDQVLSAVSTLVDNDGIGTLHYQWQHNVGGGFVNVGADQSTYTLSDADVGGTVRVVIYYTDAGGTVESATSSATATIANVNDAPTGSVSVGGTTTEDQTLTANTATLADGDGLGTLHYQWQRNTGSGYVDVGSDQVTYTLGDADVGALIRVVTSYTDGQGASESVTSSATGTIAGVNDPHTGGASISGTETEDQILTAISTLADVDGLGTLHYQWQRNTGGGFFNVGSDQATYTLGDADIGGTVRVIISYTDGQGFSESATSSATGTIANIDDLAVAQNDAFTTTETSTIGTGLSVFDDNGNGADFDPDSALSIIEINGTAASVGAAVTLASGALLTLNSDGTFSYDPNGAFDDLPGAASGASNLTRDDSFTYTLAGGDIATVVVTVSGVDSDGDILKGIDGTNDVFTGGIGSDHYFIGDAGDTIIETSGQGTADRVFAAVSFALAVDDDIEIISTSSSNGKAAIDLTGNRLAQTIYGNAGKNILHDGGAGAADRMSGGDGNDIYIIYNAGDVIIERAGEGSDRVSAGTNYTLGSGTEIELLNTTSLNGTRALDLTGNRFAQLIRGNAGDNILNDGGSGDADSLIGGKGDDTYIVYNSGDTITELTNQGDDRVSVAVDFVLANDVSVEYLNTTSSSGMQAIDLTGNNLDQLVRGNAGSNTIDGGAGSDLLYGMGGQDSFRFSTTLGVGNIDRIADFSAADDRIELDHAIFATLSLGALNASAFKDSAVGVKDADDRIIYNSDTGALVYDADGSGSAFDSVRFATVIGDPVLTAADFFVV